MKTILSAIVIIIIISYACGCTGKREKLLFDAVDRGNLSEVEEFIKSGVNINIARPYTPLTLATRHSNYEMVTLLLKYNADVNLIDKTGRTSLSTAAWGGDQQMVTLLIHEGAITTGTYGLRALSSAAHNGHEDIINILLKSNSNINEKWPVSGKTLLMGLAPYDLYNDMTSYLLAVGADVNLRDNNGCNALIHAARRGNINAVKLIIQNTNVIDEDITLLKSLFSEGWVSEPKISSDKTYVPVQVQAEIFKLIEERKQNSSLRGLTP